MHQTDDLSSFTVLAVDSKDILFVGFEKSSYSVSPLKGIYYFVTCDSNTHSLIIAQFPC